MYVNVHVKVHFTNKKNSYCAALDLLTFVLEILFTQNNVVGRMISQLVKEIAKKKSK